MAEALTALITDLPERRLNQTMMIVACRESERTPRVTHACVYFANPIGLAHDHWPNPFSALVAGRGLRMGQVIGQTNSKSEYVMHNPSTPQDFPATIYRHLQIHYRHEFTNDAGYVPVISRSRSSPELHSDSGRQYQSLLAANSVEDR